MIGTIFKKELTEFLRDKRFLSIAAILLLLLAAASLDGWNRAKADADARDVAVASDREIWVEQGENNPHGAAHFARYAFRPAPALAAFDPGVFDYAGAAFWMEAHTQNPTTLRRAEDTAVQAPFSSLSPAWIIQVVGSLAFAVLLFATVAGERERGTLKSLAATGVPTAKLAFGKFSAIFAFVGSLSLLLIGLSILPSLISGGLSGSLKRVILIGLVYALSLGAFAFTIFWLSARSRSTGSAFIAGAFAWLFLALVWPAMSGQIAVSLFPDQDEQQLKNDIQLKANTPFWVGDAQEPAVAALEAKVVEKYGGESFEALGFSRDALVLQAHEEYANEIYDEIYGALYSNHLRQDSVLRYASILSPILATQRLSSALAGTDLQAQLMFAQQAEQHRRTIIGDLNEDMMVNGGENGYAYTADRSLWEATKEFDPKVPALSSIMNDYRIEWISLLLWLIGMLLLSLRATRRAMEQEAC